MTFASILCLRKDVDRVLEMLDDLGNFHIENNNDEPMTAEDRRLLQQIEESKAKAESAIMQLGLDKSNFLDIFREHEIDQTRMISEDWNSLAKETVEEISKLKRDLDGFAEYKKSQKEKRTELEKFQEMFLILENSGANISHKERMKFIYSSIASVPRKNLQNLEKAFAAFPSVLQHCYLTKDYDFVCIAITKKHQDEAEKILKTHHADILTIPPDMPEDLSQARIDIANKLAEISDEEAKLAETIADFRATKSERIFVMLETAENVQTSLRSKLGLTETNKLATIRGFVPQDELSKLRDKTRKLLKENALIFEGALNPEADPPTLFHNNKLIKPFEEITKLYGLPHYDEIDPTPIIALTFPLLFGLMFGDLGHGLILLATGLILALLIKNGTQIKNFALILGACGASATFWGLLFGEFFGKTIFPPIWFNPIDNIYTFLLFSLTVGISQIMIGLILDFANFVWKKKMLDAVSVSIPKIAFYLGSIYLILSYKLNFGLWLKGPILFSIIPLVFIIIGKPLATRIASITKPAQDGKPSESAFVQSFFEGSELVTRLLSNTISYSRILALLMVHWALLLVIYVIAGLISSSTIFGIILSTIVIVAGNIFVIGFEGLIVFVQVLRLHFYEWFSRFFEGTGTPFSPFKHKHTHSEIVIKK
jgi:V/A-type H+-transporting ATPase subunit I